MVPLKNLHPRQPLRQIYFYLSDGCNLRCRHCWVLTEAESVKGKTSFLYPELIQHILLQARPLGLETVKLTGGEPLLHPELPRILEIIRRADLRLVLETNGVLLTPGLAADLARCRRVHVAVSLDGTEADTHEWLRGVSGCFQAALKGIRALVAAGIRPQIIFSLFRRNRDQVPAIVELAEKLGAKSVKFNVIQSSPRADRLAAAAETLSVAEVVALGRLVERELSPKAGIPLLFHYPPAFRDLSRILAEDGEGCGICGILQILGVLADGSYALCGIGSHVPELVFGHAAREPLAEVWQEHPILTEIRQGLPFRLTGICGRCILRSLCLGFCLAQNYYHAHDLWAPYWFCEQAEAEGIFPETRKLAPQGVECLSLNRERPQGKRKPGLMTYS